MTALTDEAEIKFGTADHGRFPSPKPETGRCQPPR